MNNLEERFRENKEQIEKYFKIPSVLEKQDKYYADCQI